MARRAPRAVRRGRKCKARPTSHDGLTVIIAYGNRQGYDVDGRPTGRLGKSVVECRDGTRLEIRAGGSTHARPELVKHHALPFVWQQRIDYRGPYYAVQVRRARTSAALHHDILLLGDVHTVRTAQLRHMIDAAGGFARMVPMSGRQLHMARAAAEGARMIYQLGQSMLAASSAWAQVTNRFGPVFAELAESGKGTES